MGRGSGSRVRTKEYCWRDGVLSSTHRRTATVKTTYDCDLGCVSADDFQRVYFADPSLGLALIQLIIDRLTRDAQVSQLEAAAA